MSKSQEKYKYQIEIDKDIIKNIFLGIDPKGKGKSLSCDLSDCHQKIIILSSNLSNITSPYFKKLKILTTPRKKSLLIH